MIPFRVYDPEEKITWLVLNFHQQAGGGTYLAAREEDSDSDGFLNLLSLEKISNCRFIEFLKEEEE